MRTLRTLLVVLIIRRDPLESMAAPGSSPWDDVLSDIKEMPPPLHRSNAAAGARRNRRQTMTARELHVFDDMFDMIFDSVSDPGAPKASGSATTNDVGIGKGGIDDIFSKLRRHSKKAQRTQDTDEAFDRKKESINLCETDAELLAWAMKDVFEESQKFEEAAKQAVAETSGQSSELPMLQPPAYADVVALLMRTFREKYQDPNLALAIFNYVRHLSIASYVFGCSTKTYNELIEIRWSCFQDLQGVHDALEEMAINCVDVDSQTRRLVETIRREIGEQNLWVNGNEVGSGETWKILTKVEQLVSKPGTKVDLGQKPVNSRDSWKSELLEDDHNDNWGFDQWDPHARYQQPFGLKT